MEKIRTGFTVEIHWNYVTCSKSSEKFLGTTSAQWGFKGVEIWVLKVYIKMSVLQNLRRIQI